MEEKKDHEAKENHQEHHVKHHTKHKKKTNVWMYISAVLVIILAVSVYFNVAGSSGGLSSDQASKEFMNFVNDNLLEAGMTADLKNVEEANGVYEVELDVGGQSFVSYITKDAAIFFPQGYVIADLEDELSGAGAAATEEVEAAAVKADVPNIKMFVMTFCPYGQQAENGLGPALDVLGDSVEFEPHFVFYSDYASRMGAEWDQFCWDEDETYCSMHGIGELNEGIRQLCIYDQYPNKWWDYVNAINADCDYTNVDTCWEDIAEDVGLDVSKIETCFEEKGELYLKKEVLLAKQFGVQGSPSIFINDASYSGGRAPENYKTAICNSFNDAPSECGETLSTTGAAATGDCG